MQNGLISRRFSPENGVNGRDGRSVRRSNRAETTLFAPAEIIPRHPAPTTGCKQMKHTRVNPTQTAVTLPNTANINIADLGGSGWYNFTVTAAAGGFQETADSSVFVADETIYLPLVQR